MLTMPPRAKGTTLPPLKTLPIADSESSRLLKMPAPLPPPPALDAASEAAKSSTAAAAAVTAVVSSITGAFAAVTDVENVASAALLLA